MIKECEIFKLKLYSAGCLTTPSCKVINFDKSKYALILKNMLEILNNYNGLGLAAPQVGINEQFFIMRSPTDLDPITGKPLVINLFNPEIIDKHENEQSFSYEGCLSLPGMEEVEIPRIESLTLKYLNENFEECQMYFKGLPAYIVQHELDHLMGKLIMDYLPKLTRKMFIEKMYKRRKKLARRGS